MKLSRLVAIMELNSTVDNSDAMAPILEKHKEHVEQLLSRRVLKAANSLAASQTKGRQVFVVRHGERVDFTFGTWIPYSFDDAGMYVRKDLNMPKSLPQRKPDLWQQDSPLTNLGCYQARSSGETLKEAGVCIDRVFSSPAFRCIQTATSIMEGLGLREKVPVQIEPALFEWLGWYPEVSPEWMSSDELIAAGYNVSKTYTPFISEEDLKQRRNEMYVDYYRRSAALAEHLVKNTDGNILIVGHAATLDSCTRPLVCPSAELPPLRDLMTKLVNISFCSVVTVESTDDGAWKLGNPPCGHFTNTRNDRFDWNTLS